MDTRAPGTYVTDTPSSTDNIRSASGVAWAAIIGGAFGAAGLTLILAPLGAAMGYAVSPWHYDAGRAFTIMSAIWLILVQWLSSGLGGYLTGRLRTKWIAAHTHEVFFRDTVHGFLAWALAAVMGALLLAAMVVGGNSSNNASSSYIVNGLFRSATVTAGTTAPSASANLSDQDRMESDRIITMGVVNGQIPETDRDYLAQLIINRTGISVVEAQTRIDNAVSEGKVIASTASKTSLFICLSLLIGAFIAAAAGALGGIHRDVHYETGRLI